MRNSALSTVFVLGIAAVLLAGTAMVPAVAEAWKTVRISIDATYPPFESIDSRRQTVGREIDYGNALCARMRVTFTFQNQDLDGIIPSLLGGKFDVTPPGMNVMLARQEKVLSRTFTMPLR